MSPTPAHRPLSAAFAAALVAAALVIGTAAPAAAEFPAGYQPGRDDNFMRVAEPPLYLAGFILDWVVYRPIHAVMTVATGGAEHPFTYEEHEAARARVRHALDRASEGEAASSRYASRE